MWSWPNSHDQGVEWCFPTLRYNHIRKTEGNLYGSQQRWIGPRQLIISLLALLWPELGGLRLNWRRLGLSKWTTHPCLNIDYQGIVLSALKSIPTSWCPLDKGVSILVSRSACTMSVFLTQFLPKKQETRSLLDFYDNVPFEWVMSMGHDRAGGSRRSDSVLTTW